ALIRRFRRFREILEIVLVETDAVVLPAEPAAELRGGRGVELVLLRHPLDLAQDQVRVLDVALVELEMVLEHAVAEALHPQEAREVAGGETVGAALAGDF